MKKSAYIITIGIVVTLVVIGWWHQRTRVPETEQKPIEQEGELRTTSPTIAIVSNSAGQIKSTVSSEGEKTVNTPKRSPGNRQTAQRILLEENKKSLDLYGLVVDQYGEPVVGARVRGSIGYNISMVQSGGEFRYAETDSQGRFNFLGIHGAGIGLWPEKTGYYYNPKLPSTTRPNDYLPDSNNPLVIKMWKLKGAQPLEHAVFESRIPYDGTSVCFDLRTGKKLATTDEGLRIALLRSPLQIAPGLLHPYDWRATVEIANGGIIEANDTYPYWAPETGYQRLFETGVSSNDVPWQAELRRSFYIKNAQGHHGLIRIELPTSSKRPDTGIKVETWINPSGSQNLELNPVIQAQSKPLVPSLSP
jgi:hypothetical protein